MLRLCSEILLDELHPVKITEIRKTPLNSSADMNSMNIRLNILTTVKQINKSVK